MPIDDNEAPKANFFYVDKDGNYLPLGEFTFSADISMSEGDIQKMVKLTQSLAVWLIKNHKDKYTLITFGHLEEFTDEMKEEYMEWLKTEEGRSYLKGGSNYDTEYAKKIGLE